VRGILSIALITVLTAHAQPIGTRRKLSLGGSAIILGKILLYFGPTDALAYAFSEWVARDPEAAPLTAGNVAIRIVSFIVHSFLWELVFDFGHYWVHRMCHASSFLYQHVHKTHHQHRSPSPLTTYDHHVLDVVGSNLLPALFAFYTLGFFGAPIRGRAERHGLFAFKSYVEVAGHSGAHVRPRSFPQFTWLPGWIPCMSSGVHTYRGIGGHTCEHDWHHAVLRCNFSKRFRVWDVLFGTYEAPPHQE